MRVSELKCPHCYNTVPWPTHNKGASLSSSQDVFRCCIEMATLDHEQFHVLLLDTKNYLLRRVVMSIGSMSASLVHPRETFKEAVREPAQSVMLVHNHPSGDPQPSDEDRALTRRLVGAGDILGIRVLDHVIIGMGDYFSFADQGILR